MKKVIKNNYKIMIGIIIGIIFSVTSVYAVDAYIESKKISYDSKYTKKNNVQDAIDELYERSGIHKDKWIDPILNGADPVLKDNLIPVEIDPNGKVYKANLYSEWYNYSEKKWANAIILNNGKTTEDYDVGAEILNADIKGYFVWIPRYQYKIWDLGNYSSTLSFTNITDSQNTVTSENSLWKLAGNNVILIDIKFGSANKIPKMVENDAKVGEYYTHPAFTLGSRNLNGFWMGKFETGKTSTNEAVVKPNETSYRYENLKTFFDISRNYEVSLDSHMLRNTEWGAAAYLSHSIYGIGTEVRINNTKDYKTGYSAASNTNQSKMPSEEAVSIDKTKTQPWNTLTGYLASTTGNISGVYDMSGCAWEYVAGCIEGMPGNNNGFDVTTLATEMNNGYIDKYDKNSAITNYNKRILGDATGEIGLFYFYYDESGYAYYHSSWYNSLAYFVDSNNPWFRRGGSYVEGSTADQFAFARGYNGGQGFGFRISLAL